MMINFTFCQKRNKTYAGANGNKISIVYNRELYMLKFPSVAGINKQMSYTNGCISEYIGCHIFESIGIPAQETLLGIYSIDGKEKTVVACKDFTVGGLTLQDFASLKNTVVDTARNGYGTELTEIEQTFTTQTLVDPDTLIERFWNMFIVDALLGNWDRHNGNWGFLYNEKKDTISFAPVFDCGSCLFPQADENIMRDILTNQRELKIRIYDRPLSCITIKDKKINYFNFISSLENEDCNNALKRIVPRIDLNEIEKIITQTPLISDLQKNFYFTMVRERKTHILDYSLQKLIDREKQSKMPRRTRDFDRDER